MAGWWFGSAKKSRKPRSGSRSKRKRPARKPPRSPITPQQLWQVARPAAALLAIAMLVYGWMRAEQYLSDYASRKGVTPASLASHNDGAPGVVTSVATQPPALPQPLHLGANQITLATARPWMSPMLRTQISDIVALEASPDPLDAQSLNRAAAALAASPWVERVDRLVRTADGIAVYAEYREPIALVHWSGSFHLVDMNGVRLPGEYRREHLDKLAMPLLIGAQEAPAELGQPWPGRDVQAGLDLVKLLGGEPFAEQIKAYDVSARDARGRIRLTLHTRQGQVRWGLPPGQERAVEPDAATKLHWLRNVNARRGAIDAGGKVVEVYGGAVFVHQTPGRQPLGR